jgi:hypothetical protein
VAALSIIPLFSQTNCVLRKDKDGVRVFACDAENTKIKSLKTVLEVKATVPQVIAMVLDVNNYNNWQYNTIHAHIIKKISETELIYYTEVVAPWPVSNRDLVVHLKIARDSTTGNTIISANSIPDFIPEKEGIVRVPLSKSQWTVKSTDEASLSIEFVMLINPGGSVPAWMINMVAAEAPYESFRDFKKKIESH